MLFEPLCKGSARFSNVFFSTPLFIALVSIYDSTLVVNRIIVLGSHKEAFDDLSSFEMYLYLIFATCFLDSLTEALMIWNHHIQVLVAVVLNKTGSAENKVKSLIKSLTSFHWYPY